MHTHTHTHTRSYDYDAVRRWTTPKQLKAAGQASPDLLSVDLVICPVNDNNVHWVCVVIDIKGRRLVYMDSMGGQVCVCASRLYASAAPATPVQSKPSKNMPHTPHTHCFLTEPRPP
jgi:Ulp1 family protease